MFPARDIHPLTDFKRNTAAFRARLKKTGRPVLLTVDGRADLVVLDAESYERLLTFGERAELRETLGRRVEKLKDGAAVPAAEAFDAMRARQQRRVRRSA
jgi:prevent-host-death family protein